MLRPLLACAIAVSTLACDGTERAAREQTDHGTVCASATPEPSAPQTFMADAPVYLLYETGCFSSSCTDALEAACELTVDGSTLHVTSTTSWIDTGSRVCTADCWGARSSCGSAPLVAGEYTIVFGAATIELTIPSTLDAAPCATTLY